MTSFRAEKCHRLASKHETSVCAPASNSVLILLLLLLLGQTSSTRKLSYRKDDRAMRPIYGCPENFRVSLTSTTPTATFPDILMDFFPIIRSILLMCIQNLKFLALPFLR